MMNKQSPALIAVDIRSDSVNSGKTVIAQILLDALADYGWDPEGVRTQVDNQDGDLSTDPRGKRRDRDLIRQIVSRLNEKGTELVISDLNLPLYREKCGTPARVYEYLTYSSGVPCTEYKPCTYDQYLRWLKDPMENGVMHHVRTRIRTHETDGLVVRESDVNHLEKLVRNLVDYIVVKNEQWGDNELQSHARALTHHLRGINNKLYITLDETSTNPEGQLRDFFNEWTSVNNEGKAK